MDPLLSQWLIELLLRQPDITAAVSEFHLRKPFEHASLISLLEGLPFPSDSPILQKLFLLKKLEHDVSRAPVSEATLEMMDQIATLSEQENDDDRIAAVQRANSAVVLDCTSRLGRDAEFEKMVKRRMDENECLGFSWVNELVKNDETHEAILRRWNGVSGKNAVVEFVAMEMARMGPGHLEEVVNAKRENIITPSTRLSRRNLHEIGRENNSAEMKVKRPFEELKLSARELEREFNDSVDLSSQELRRLAKGKYVVNQSPASTTPNTSTRTNHCGDGSQRRVVFEAPSSSPKRRINTSSFGCGGLTPNRTGSSSARVLRPRVEISGVFRVQTPNMTDSSPEKGSCKRRRSIRRWTEEEEDTLIIGVNRFKKGRWKEILTKFGYVFEDRTEVDLKDKWRNMTKAEKRNG